MITERWLPVSNYEGLYEVSDIGRVRSLPRNGTAGVVLKNRIMKNGYVGVILSKGNRIKNLLVHRLVGAAFVSNYGWKPCVNHKNSIRTDNRVENLEWVTRGENTQHGYDFGNMTPPRQIPVIDTITKIEYPSVTSAAIALGISQTGLSSMLRGVYKNNTPIEYKNTRNV